MKVRIVFSFLFVAILSTSVLLCAEEKSLLTSDSGIHKKWTGDLDGMVQRRLIRVLTVYNKMTYFLDKDTQRGIAYDAMKEFETNLNKGRKLEEKVHVVFIPVSRDELFPKLVAGQGDVAIANLTITPERQKIVDFTIPTYAGASEIVVTGPGAPAINTVADLSGQEVFVRESSSYYASLQTLNQKFKAEGKKPVELTLAPEALENEDLLEMTNAGIVKIMITEKTIAEFWKQVFPSITLHPEAAVRSGADIAWSIRKNSPKFTAELNAFIKTHGKGTAFGNTLLNKYLKSIKYIKESTSEAELKKYDALRALFKKYGDQYSVDWLLMAAQGYQESLLNQEVKSPVGAIGVMQIMPATGGDLKVGDITVLEPNIHGGVKYMRFMMDQYYKNEPMSDLNKMLMTFASYNCGPGKMRSMRKLTAERGLDPNVWFNNVERVVAEKVGQETVTYVSNIYKYYIAYQLVREQKMLKKAAKEEVKK